MFRFRSLSMGVLAALAIGLPAMAETVYLAVALAAGPPLPSAAILHPIAE